MSRRSTREAHAKSLARQRELTSQGRDAEAFLEWRRDRDQMAKRSGCPIIPALVLLLGAAMLSDCSNAPNPRDQADLMLLGETVSHASACIPAEEATASMQALSRLGARLTSKAQAEALWQAATPTLTAVAHWLADWLLQRPPP